MSDQIIPPVNERVFALNTIAGNIKPGFDWDELHRQYAIHQSEVFEIQDAIINRDILALRDAIGDDRVTGTDGFRGIVPFDMDADFDEITNCLFSRFDQSEEDALETKAAWERKGIAVDIFPFNYQGVLYFPVKVTEDSYLADGELYPKGKWVKSVNTRLPNFEPYPDTVERDGVSVSNTIVDSLAAASKQAVETGDWETAFADKRTLNDIINMEKRIDRLKQHMITKAVAIINDLTIEQAVAVVLSQPARHVMHGIASSKYAALAKAAEWINVNPDSVRPSAFLRGHGLTGEGYIYLDLARPDTSSSLDEVVDRRVIRGTTGQVYETMKVYFDAVVKAQENLEWDGNRAVPKQK